MRFSYQMVYNRDLDILGLYLFTLVVDDVIMYKRRGFMACYLRVKNCVGWNQIRLDKTVVFKVILGYIQ